MSFAESVKEVLRARHITQNELARAASISSSGISYALREGGNPSLITMEAIAAALDVSLGSLLSESKDRDILTVQEMQLLSVLRSLNDEGRARIVEYAEDLATLPKYKEEPEEHVG